MRILLEFTCTSREVSERVGERRELCVAPCAYHCAVGAGGIDPPLARRQQHAVGLQHLQVDHVQLSAIDEDARVAGRGIGRQRAGHRYVGLDPALGRLVPLAPDAGLRVVPVLAVGDRGLGVELEGGDLVVRERDAVDRDVARLESRAALERAGRRWWRLLRYDDARAGSRRRGRGLGSSSSGGAGPGGRRRLGAVQDSMWWWLPVRGLVCRGTADIVMV